MWGDRTKHTWTTRARAGLLVAALTVGAACLAGTTPAAGTSEGASSKPGRPGPSMEALGERARPLPAGTKTTTKTSAPCWQSSYADPTGDVDGIDATQASLSLDCAAAQWTFSVHTASTWTTNDLYGVGLFVDNDNDDATGCFGTEYAIALFNFDTLETSAIKTPSCNDDGSDDGSWIELGSPIGYQVQGGSKLATLQFSHTMIKNPTSFRFFGVIDDWDTWDPDFLPDAGWNAVTGVPGDLSLGLPKAFDSGPSPTIDGSFDASVAGDFNGDGRDDLFLYGAGTRGDVLKLGQANATFANGPRPTVTGTYDAVVAGDFNGDGRDDLLLYADGQRRDILKLGSGGATFTNGPAFLMNNGVYDRVVAGDFDGDGRSDVLGYGFSFARDDLFYGAADAKFKTAALMSKSGRYRPVAGDFNGDGRSDVVWYAPGKTADALSLGRDI